MWREAGIGTAAAHPASATAAPDGASLALAITVAVPLPDCLQLLLADTLALTPAETARQTSLKLTPRLAACCVELPEDLERLERRVGQWLR